MTIEEALENTKPWGCLADPMVELPAISKEVEGRKTMLEIGTFQGATSAALALVHPELKITTIDLPDPTRASNPHAKSSSEIGIAIRTLGLDKQIEQMRMDSANLGAFVREWRQFDLIFVDGSHKRDDVFRDLSWSEKLITKDGIILAHDYTGPEDSDRPSWTIEVYEAVEKFLNCYRTWRRRRLPKWLVALERI
jgi:predicted O-methyltransferase YrrM